MAHFPGWEKVPMAAGDKAPLWPLPTVTPKFSATSFGGGRPWACKEEDCERWHAGIDLTDAPGGSVVVAPEPGTIVGLDQGWTEGTKAVYLATDSGLFLVFGGVVPGSHKEFGRTLGRVSRGDPLGRILASYGMLHFETYVAGPERKKNSPWAKGSEPPKGLLNPYEYVKSMGNVSPGEEVPEPGEQTPPGEPPGEQTTKAPSKAAKLVMGVAAGVVLVGVAVFLGRGRSV